VLTAGIGTALVGYGSGSTWAIGLGAFTAALAPVGFFVPFLQASSRSDQTRANIIDGVLDVIGLPGARKSSRGAASSRRVDGDGANQ
jgi:hypothetical protein